LRRATWRHSHGAQLIRAFDLSLCLIECGVFRSADEQNPPASGNPEIRKDALARRDSSCFPHRLAQRCHGSIDGCISRAPSRHLAIAITYPGRCRS